MKLSYLIDEGMSIKEYLMKMKFPYKAIHKNKRLSVLYYVNNQAVLNYYQLKKNDQLELIINDVLTESAIIPIKEAFKIVYEDEYFLIVDKKPNLACIPTIKHYNNSLANHIMAYYKEKGIIANIHFINRIDYPTSGLVLLAKNGYLHALMREVSITKEYLARVRSHLPQEEDILVFPIKKKTDNIILREVNPKGDQAKTRYRLLSTRPKYSLVKVLLETGRTHQIRVHFSYINHPIIGDNLYGTKTEDELLYLHSCRIAFINPITKKEIDISSTPDHWQEFD